MTEETLQKGISLQNDIRRLRAELYDSKLLATAEEWVEFADGKDSIISGLFVENEENHWQCELKGILPPKSHKKIIAVIEKELRALVASAECDMEKKIATIKTEFDNL